MKLTPRQRTARQLKARRFRERARPLRIADKRLYRVTYAWPVGNGSWVDCEDFIMAATKAAAIRAVRKHRKELRLNWDDNDQFHNASLVKVLL